MNKNKCLDDWKSKMCEKAIVDEKGYCYTKSNIKLSSEDSILCTGCPYW